MGTFFDATWESDGTDGACHQHAGGRYRWYLPSGLADVDLSLDPDVVQDVVRAERELFLTGVSALESGGIEGIARLLLRCESVASSHIEGLSIGARRLLRAELFEEEPDNLRFDKSALAVLGNIHAMSDAITLADGGAPITVETICDIHRSLCRRRTTRFRLITCLPPPSTWVLFSTTLRPSATGTTSPRSSRPPSPTPSSRRFTPLSMETAGPAGP